MINPMAIMSMIPQIKGNPLGILSQNGFSAPKNMSDPHDIVNHLVSSGQIDQNVINQAMQIAQSMGIKL